MSKKILLVLLLFLVTGCMEKVESTVLDGAYHEGYDDTQQDNPGNSVFANEEKGFYYFNDGSLFYYEIEKNENIQLLGNMFVDGRNTLKTDGVVSSSKTVSDIQGILMKYLDELYMFESVTNKDNSSAMYLGKLSKDGTKYERVGELNNIVNYSIIHRNTVYYSQKNNKKIDSDEYTLFYAPLDDFKNTKQLVEGFVSNLIGQGNYVYFLGDVKWEGKKYKNALFRFDIINEKLEVIKDNSIGNFVTVGERIVYSDVENTYIYDLETKEDKVLIEGFVGNAYVTQEKVMIDNRMSSLLTGSPHKVMIYDVDLNFREEINIEEIEGYDRSIIGETLGVKDNQIVYDTSNDNQIAILNIKEKTLSFVTGTVHE